MGKVFGIDLSWAPQYLVSKASHATADADWALEGLTDFARMVIARGSLEKRWTAADIVAWALGSEDYSECVQLSNPRRLGRYISANKVLVASIAGIHEAGKSGNKQMYVVRRTATNGSNIHMLGSLSRDQKNL
jgi:citrate lyase beta subunit